MLFEDHSSAFQTNNAVEGVVERLTMATPKAVCSVVNPCDPFYHSISKWGYGPGTFRLWSSASGLPRERKRFSKLPLSGLECKVLLRECPKSWSSRCTPRLLRVETYAGQRRKRDKCGSVRRRTWNLITQVNKYSE